MTTLALTLSDRLRAAEYALRFPYDGPHNMRWCLGTAAQVEAFPNSYAQPLVDAAVGLLLAASQAQSGGVDEQWVRVRADRFIEAYKEVGSLSTIRQ